MLVQRITLFIMIQPANTHLLTFFISSVKLAPFNGLVRILMKDDQLIIFLAIMLFFHTLQLHLLRLLPPTSNQIVPNA